METRNNRRLPVLVVLVASALVVIALPAMADDLGDELIAIEKAGWDAWANNDGQAYVKDMADDAFTINESGIIMGRDDLMAFAEGHNCNLANLELGDVKVHQLSPDVAILTYTALQDGECGGEAMPESVTSTAVYVRQDGEWRWMSYQETPLE